MGFAPTLTLPRGGRGFLFFWGGGGFWGLGGWDLLALAFILRQAQDECRGGCWGLRVGAVVGLTVCWLGVLWAGKADCGG